MPRSGAGLDVDPGQQLAQPPHQLTIVHAAAGGDHFTSIRRIGIAARDRSARSTRSPSRSGPGSATPGGDQATHELAAPNCSRPAVLGGLQREVWIAQHRIEQPLMHRAAARDAAAAIECVACPRSCARPARRSPYCRDRYRTRSRRRGFASGRNHGDVRDPADVQRHAPTRARGETADSRRRAPAARPCRPAAMSRSRKFEIVRTPVRSATTAASPICNVLATRRPRYSTGAPREKSSGRACRSARQSCDALATQSCESRPRTVRPSRKCSRAMVAVCVIALETPSIASRTALG